MFDRVILSATKHLVDRMARTLGGFGCTANAISFFAFGLGMLAAVLIAFHYPMLALVPLLLGRALDGLDGAVARLGQPTDRGAFIDISLDFIFYASIPLAFVIAEPQINGLAGAVLLAAFVGTGSSFLAYAIIAEKRGLKSLAYPSKSFYYLGGLTEGTETIICFVAMAFWPQHFSIIAFGYSALCVITIITRLIAGWKTFDPAKG